MTDLLVSEQVGLTPREIEVLTLLVEGVDSGAIRTRLGIKRHTLRNHCRNILWKMGAHSRLEAVAMATGRRKDVA